MFRKKENFANVTLIAVTLGLFVKDIDSIVLSLKRLIGILIYLLKQITWALPLTFAIIIPQWLIILLTMFSVLIITGLILKSVNLKLYNNITFKISNVIGKTVNNINNYFSSPFADCMLVIIRYLKESTLLLRRT